MLDKNVSLSRPTSLPDFFKPSSGTWVSPPVLLDIGYDDTDDPNTVH